MPIVFFLFMGLSQVSWGSGLMATQPSLLKPQNHALIFGGGCETPEFKATSQFRFPTKKRLSFNLFLDSFKSLSKALLKNGWDVTALYGGSYERESSSFEINPEDLESIVGRPVLNASKKVLVETLKKKLFSLSQGDQLLLVINTHGSQSEESAKSGSFCGGDNEIILRNDPEILGLLKELKNKGVSMGFIDNSCFGGCAIPVFQELGCTLSSQLSFLPTVFEAEGELKDNEAVNYSKYLDLLKSEPHRLSEITRGGVVSTVARLLDPPLNQKVNTEKLTAILGDRFTLEDAFLATLVWDRLKVGHHENLPLISWFNESESAFLKFCGSHSFERYNGELLIRCVWGAFKGEKVPDYISPMRANNRDLVMVDDNHSFEKLQRYFDFFEPVNEYEKLLYENRSVEIDSISTPSDVARKLSQGISKLEKLFEKSKTDLNRARELYFELDKIDAFYEVRLPVQKFFDAGLSQEEVDEFFFGRDFFALAALSTLESWSPQQALSAEIAVAQIRNPSLKGNELQQANIQWASLLPYYNQDKSVLVFRRDPLRNPTLTDWEKWTNDSLFTSLSSLLATRKSREILVAESADLTLSTMGDQIVKNFLENIHAVTLMSKAVSNFWKEAEFSAWISLDRQKRNLIRRLKREQFQIESQYLLFRNLIDPQGYHTRTQVMHAPGIFFEKFNKTYRELSHLVTASIFYNYQHKRDQIQSHPELFDPSTREAFKQCSNFVLSGGRFEPAGENP
jgi:hypothetical protein